MQLREAIESLGLCPDAVADDTLEVQAVYCGDLLSDVLAHAPPHALWFTIQSHVNIVAVAQLRDVAAVVLVNGVAPQPQTIVKARDQEVNLCSSTETSAALCMRLAGRLAP
ncbi:MAG: iron-sulfur binding hydrogenase [Kiritimatiellia bacterium]